MPARKRYLAFAAGRRLQRPQTRPRDLAARHLGGHGIADPRARFPRPARCARGREIEPFVGLDDIAGHPLPLVIEQAERILREAVALLRGAAVPHRRFGIVLRNAAAGLEKETQIGLRRPLPLPSHPNEDLPRLLIIPTVESRAPIP